jgi:hypothetical protein
MLGDPCCRGTLSRYLLWGCTKHLPYTTWVKQQVPTTSPRNLPTAVTEHIGQSESKHRANNHRDGNENAFGFRRPHETIVGLLWTPESPESPSFPFRGSTIIVIITCCLSSESVSLHAAFSVETALHAACCTACSAVFRSCSLACRTTPRPC